MLKKLALPFYRITIWVSNRRKPLQGIRQIDNYNIDVVYNMIKNTARDKIHGSRLMDVEVAMLPKRCTAVVRYLESIHANNVKDKNNAVG